MGNLRQLSHSGWNYTITWPNLTRIVVEIQLRCCLSGAGFCIGLVSRQSDVRALVTKTVASKRTKMAKNVNWQRNDIFISLVSWSRTWKENTSGSGKNKTWLICSKGISHWLHVVTVYLLAAWSFVGGIMMRTLGLVCFTSSIQTLLKMAGMAYLQNVTEGNQFQ